MGAVACLTQPGFAQQANTGAIKGVVSDSQKAVIPGAKVQLTNLGTSQMRAATTDVTGFYQFPLIPVGQYQVTVASAGFKTSKQTNITVQVNETVKVDITMEVGEVSTTVTVKALASTVETSNATIKDVVDQQRVVDLPLNGRNLADLTMLVPGVQSAAGVAGGSGDGAKESRAARKFSINGSRQNNIKFTLDGGTNMDSLKNLSNPYPFPDAVQEFSVETSNGGAEVGKSSGGSVNIVTKSGTNQFHGNGFWFVRNTAFNANDFFSTSPDGLKRNQAGGTLGGPIIKNKLFVFGGYQRTWVRRAVGDSKAFSMPANHRSGDFSDLLAGDNPLVVRDPLTGEPFPGNKIPAQRHSPTALNLLKYSPLPGADGFTRYVLNNNDELKEYVIRGDYHHSDRHNFFVRYYQNDDLAPRFMIPDNIHSNRRAIAGYSKNGTAAYTFIISPNMITDTHFTVSRYSGNRVNDFPVTIADLGAKINPSSREIDVRIDGTSGINLRTTRGALFARTNYEFKNGWNWIKGMHNFTWGFELNWQQYNEYNVFQGSGRFEFDGRRTGFDQADYLIGDMKRFRQSNGEIEFRRFAYRGFYFGDSIRVHPRLTLTFAVRYEPFSPMTDLQDRAVQFRQEAYAAGQSSSHYVNSPPGLLYPQDPGIPKGGVASDLNNIAPRIGFAWAATADGKTSVRGGYGIFYDTPEMWLLNNMNVQTPFSFTVDFQDGLFDDPYRGREQKNVFPFAGDFNPKTPFDLPFFAAAYQRKFLVPYTQNWNLTVERQFLNDWLLRLAYVGTKGTQLYGDVDLNPPVYDHSKSLAENQATEQVRRPRAEYQGLIAKFNGLNQIYNSFQLSLNKRFSQGFSIQTSYTFSRNIDYSSRNDNILNQLVDNPLNYFYGRGLADNQHKHRFVTSFVWAIPDPGKVANSKVLSALFGDWNLSGIVTAQSGSPYDVSTPADVLAAGGAARAKVIGPVALSRGRSRGEKVAEYFNTSNVLSADPGTFGTMGRNSLIGPRFVNLDSAIYRRIPVPALGESGGLTFRAEFFNTLNSVHLANPESRIGRSSFGQITSTSSPPRILQFAIKINF